MTDHFGGFPQSVLSMNAFCLSRVFIFLLCCPLFSNEVTATSIVATLTLIDTLPVVVHVIHTGTSVGSPDNPSDDLIYDMIDLMNDAFQKNGPMYGGADIQLEFKLAVRTPECEVSNGINRIDGSIVTNYEMGGITTNLMNAPQSAHEFYVKELSRWPNTDYINIWIVNMIDGDPYGLAGYAYFPEYNSALTDGIVIRADAVNGTNKNIIHELGHYFYLHHTFGLAWGTCLSESDCSSEGDLICDTENYNFTTVCTATTNPCTGNPWLIADPDHDYTVLNNYMGHTDCQWMFTDEQKVRMHDALETFRPGLLTSQALKMTSGSPVKACVPNAINGLSGYYGVERVKFGSLDVYSNSSMADGAFYIDRSCNQMVKVSPGENVFVRITGSFTNTQQIKVFLDYDNDGIFETPDELLL
ncbi:MAG: M43 family zinc metalloprotease, partial [Saprospiraceae bacterium]